MSWEHALQDPDRPQPVPAKFAGQWVAWDKEQRRIVAHGRSSAEVRAEATAAGHPDAVLERIPRLSERFVGKVRWHLSPNELLESASK